MRSNDQDYDYEVKDGYSLEDVYYSEIRYGEDDITTFDHNTYAVDVNDPRDRPILKNVDTSPIKIGMQLMKMTMTQL